MLKKHLAGGVKKGALTEEQAEEKFQAWVTEKQAKIDAKKSDLQKAKDAEAAKAFAAEKAANEARIAAAAPVVEEATEDTAEETAEASNEGDRLHCVVIARDWIIQDRWVRVGIH